MNLEDAITYALQGQAILFAGSGFSAGAINIRGESFKIGNSLRDEIANDCGIESTEQPLESTAQYYIGKKSDDDLIKLLKELFSVKEIKNFHENVISLPWKRIFTTNYDSVIETSAKQSGNHLKPVVLSEKVKEVGTQNICIHLNGHIDSLNKNTLFKEFKLIDKSYASETLDGNEWFELLKEDFSTAKAIIVVGYSMQYDIDIKRHFSSPNIKEKVIFIGREGKPDPISESVLNEYGTCYFVGTNGFSESITSVKKDFKPEVYRRAYRSFHFEYQESKPPCRMSFAEINSFYTKGEFTEGILSHNHGQYSYVISRSVLSYVLRTYRNKKLFLVLSSLGNGKTLFCKLLSNQLRTENVNVYTFYKEYRDVDYEINSICADKTKHSIIIIDDYKSKLNILRKFRFMNTDKITFVVTSRKSMNPSNNALISSLGIRDKDISPIYLDRLNDEEIKDLSYIIQTNSLYNANMRDRTDESIRDYIKTTCNSCFADILLEAYNSSDIKNRLCTLWEHSDNEHEENKKLAIIALMKAVMGIDIDFQQTLDLLNMDFVLSSGNESELLKELFDFDNDDIKIHSSIVAKEILRTIVGIDSLIDTIEQIVEKTDHEFDIVPYYEQLLKNLISHSHFRLFSATAENQTAILGFYENIRNKRFCKNNIFFWEQFATASVDCKEFSAAEQCIKNAEIIAKEKKENGFVPFHVANIKANYLIEKLLFFIGQGNSVSSSAAIEILQECNENLLKYYNHPDNNPSYTFRVAHKYVKVYEYYKNQFNEREKSIFTEIKVELLRRMEAKRTDEVFINHPVQDWILDLKNCIF